MTRAARHAAHGPRLARATVLVGTFTALGMGLGFLRDLLIARYFGATADTDAFMIAWTVPETVSPLIMEGAMVYALVPLFARVYARDGTLRPVVGRSIFPVTLALAAVAAVLGIAAPIVVQALAPGLAAPDLATQGFRIASVTVVFLGLAGYATAVLHTHYAFGVAATVYLAYNVGIITSVFALQPSLGILSAVIGLVVGSALMVAVQLPSVVRRIGVPRPSLRIRRSVFKAMAPAVPVILFLLLRHAQVYAERFFGSFLDPGAISHLNYAQKVAQVPVSLAFAVAVVSFPVLAQRAATADRERVGELLDRNIRIVIALVVPACAYFAVFAPYVVGLLFERGAFTAQDTLVTADVLRVYALGRVGQGMVAVAVLPLFVFREHVRAPLRAGALGLLVTVAVDVLLLPFGSAVGLAAGNAVGLAAMAWLLLRDVRERVAPVDIGGIGAHLLRATVVASVASAAGLGVAHVAAGGSGLVLPLIGGAVTLVLYAGGAQMLGVLDVRSLLGLGRARTTQTVGRR